MALPSSANYQCISTAALAGTASGAGLAGLNAAATIVNQLLQVAPTTGSNFSSLAGGLLVGSNDSNGAALAYVGPGVLRAMDGALANAGTLQASKFLSCVADGSVEWGNIAGTTGMGVSGNILTLITNGITALSISAAQNVTVAAGLAVTGNQTVGGTLGVTGQTTLAGLSAAAATLASAAVTNNATVGGTLGVTGTSTLAGVNAGATSVSTLSSSGLASLAAASISGNLGVTGTSTLGAVNAGATSVSTLGTSGLATLASASITGALTVGSTLGVTGTSTLAAVNAGATSVSTLSTSALATLASASVTGALTVGTTLGVTGTSTLAAVNAGATSVSTLSTSGLATLASASITNNATVGGTTTSTGQVIGPLGTAAAPSHTMVGQLGTGLFWDATHSGLGLSSGGSEVAYFSSGSFYTTGACSLGGNTSVNGYIYAASNFFVQSYTKGVTIRQNNLTAPTSGIIIQQGYAVSNLTSNYTLVATGSTNNSSASDTNGVFTNTGATGAVTATLPPSTTTLIGYVAKFLVTVAQTFTIAASTGDKINGGASGGNATTSTAKPGMSIEFVLTSLNNWTTQIINPGSGGAWAFT